MAERGVARQEATKETYRFLPVGTALEETGLTAYNAAIVRK
jgi:hypothetical protein